MKLDLLAVGAHPDDVELTCGGTVAKLARLGKAVGILDLSRGELGTRGTAAIRAREATRAAQVLGAKLRLNLRIPDGDIRLNRANLLKVVTVIRTYRPEFLLIPHSKERHPDHEHAHQLLKEAWYYSGLMKIRTKDKGKLQQPFRPRCYFEYMQMEPFQPSFIVDVTDVYETRVAAIKAFASQFHNPSSRDPETFLSTRQFLEFLESRAKFYGALIGVEYGEPFLSAKPVGVENPLSLIFRKD